MDGSLQGPSLDEIQAAARRIAGTALITPALPYNGPSADLHIWLKMENLQPVGSFKIRPGLNVIRKADSRALKHGVYTASSGNMAQGVAFAAREVGVPCRIYVIENQPAQAKIDALKRLGATIIPVPFEEFWQLVVEHRHPDEAGLFIHPVANRDVIAGDGTIGLEICEAIPAADTIVVPHGGGGLVCGIAAAARAIKPDIKIVSVECDESQPLAAAFRAGHPVDVEPMKNFVTGISVGPVLQDMWPLIQDAVDEVVAVSLDEICEAIRLAYVHNRIILEGGGAAPLAAALSGRVSGGDMVCVLSGGNIDRAVMAQILRGQRPD